MTPATISTGWALVAVSLLALGVLVVTYCRSAWAERRNEPDTPAADLEVVTPDYLAHVDSALRLVQGSNVVPMPSQREPGRWS